MGIDLLSLSPALTNVEKEPLLMMKAASEFMADTLDNVLNMHRIEEGKFELEMGPFNLKESIEKKICTFRGSVIKKNLSLHLKASPDFPQLIGDSHRIEHVIGNLLSNAIKFSPDNKSINVEILSEKVRSDNGGDGEVVNVIMMIKDEGPGISEENQTLLFNSFVQIRPGTLQNGQGSGLGLMFCKEIVHLHGGNISVHSILGQGSTFQWTIPFSVAAFCSCDQRLSLPNVAAPCSRDETMNGISLPQLFKPSESIVSIGNSFATLPDTPTRADNLSDLKVLIVDDSDMNRKMLMRLLQAKGLTADVREDGQKAFDTIREDLEAFKLVFMDNLMPNMNGMDATRAIRNAGYRYLIVAVTGNVMEDDVAKFLEAGVDIVISKPMRMISLDLLLKHINLYGSLSIANMKLVEKYGNISWTKRSPALCE
jgi:CheY-like chemotaxis protein